MNVIIRYCLLSTGFIFNQACQNPTEVIRLDETTEVSTKGTFQGIGLLGDSLTTNVDSIEKKGQLDKLKESRSAFSDNPTLENMIWIGRREAYLGRYDLAITTYSQVISDWPNDFEPYRHRGHRYLTIRDFEKATKDFLKAAVLMEGKPIKVEQDGIPNKLNVPLSNVQFNVWYHLGLAYYLQGEYEAALEAYKSCLKVSNNDDLKVATLDWYYRP
jgi:tetratricopeptide (TPR) repeat protein